MELATRRVYLAGSTANPDVPWMLQIARNVSDAEDGFLRDKRCLLMDRDTKFSKEFRDIIENVDVKAIRLPPRSPNLSPHLERFMRSIKEECLERMIFFGEKSLHAATLSYIDHYHAERNHQGVGNQLLIPDNEVNRTAGEVACRERLGGLLRYYYRKAAWVFRPAIAISKNWVVIPGTVAESSGKWELRILSLPDSELAPSEIVRYWVAIPAQSCAKVCI